MSDTDSNRSAPASRIGAASALPDISLRQLQYLVAVAESDTWADAASSVGVSASALSQGLSELERRLGVDMFESLGRRRRLRADARPVLDHARQVVAQTEDLTRWAGRLQRGDSGRVRVGMIDVAAVHHFPDVLRRFRSERPDVELTLSVAPSQRLLEDLRAGRLDVVTCVAPSTPVSGVDQEPLLSEPLVVLAAPSVRDVGKIPPVDWGPWLLFPEGSHSRDLVVRHLAQLGAPLDVAAESHQPDVLREMVLLGLGWTVLPTSQGATGNDATSLTVGPQLLERPLVIARRSGAVRDPAADELGELLIAAARSVQRVVERK